jgi:hypothetical protein
MLFTLPKELWNYPIIKRDLLATFSDHIRTLFKAWFKKHDIENFGLIIAIHTFSRDSSFHPHFHIIISLGGFKKNLTWKDLKSQIRSFFKRKVFSIIPLTWRERIFKMYGKDPLICPNCFTEMKLTSFHHKKYGDLYYP